MAKSDKPRKKPARRLTRSIKAGLTTDCLDLLHRVKSFQQRAASIQSTNSLERLTVARRALVEAYEAIVQVDVEAEYEKELVTGWAGQRYWVAKPVTSKPR